MKIFVYSAHRFEKHFLEKAAQGKHELVYSAYALNENTAKLAQDSDVVSVFTSDDVSAGLVNLLYDYGIRFIALRSVGYDHVDIIKTKELGIKVANVPAYSPYAVAEHGVALLMALNRKIILGQQLMKKNNFSLDDLIGFDLHGKTIGIVGTGKIGTAFAHIMNGFGCNLLGFDITPNEELIQQTNISYTSLEDLCRQSDVISLNCPLNGQTKYLFNKNLFSIMKKETIFINTARGSIVNTKDLIEALGNKTIAGAGLDVYENEKPIFFSNHLNNVIIDPIFDKLRSLPNVLITGHQAFLTKEALTGIAETTFSNINDWANGEKCPNEL
ncbi:D-lactate dehydrogenase [Flavobacterium swingsii]|jgi:D-lactate dehydrogenase|uniref:D-lactate dehydrogenase n=1 Tax=Flavobacterium swingsii TaxID=498292 RepID=A0A1I0WV07_9FLAO|nr:2-hydroxyacid dehydrogenase [Flavobacterium swingsii]SFA92579.1 D-lactate dehydrogenase [Flavobacterium swingsii]